MSLPRIYRIREQDGYVVARQDLPGETPITEEAGWRTVTAKIYQQLSEVQPGKLARISGSAVIWERASLRPLEVVRVRALEKVAGRTASEFEGRYCLQNLLELLIDHVLDTDPKSETAPERIATLTGIRDWITAAKEIQGDAESALVAAGDLADIDAALGDFGIGTKPKDEKDA